MKFKQAVKETFDEILGCFKLSWCLEVIMCVSWLILTTIAFVSGGLSIIVTLIWMFTPSEYLHQDLQFRLCIIWVTFIISGLISRISYKMMEG